MVRNNLILCIVRFFIPAKQEEDIPMQYRKKKNMRMVKEGTLIVAVDIGKQSHCGYCTTIHGDAMKPFMFDNSKSGYEKLWEMVVIGKNRFHCNNVVMGYESTGLYAEPLAHYFMHKPVKLVQVNPMHTRRLKEVNDNSPLKTDFKDPRVIADIIRLGHALSTIVPEGDAALLRRLTNARERHMRERTALLNQLQQLVFLIFPEMHKVIKDMKTKTAFYVLTHYTTPADISRASKEDLGKKLKTCSMGKFGIIHAELLIGFAKNTVGITEGREGIVLDIRHALTQLKTIEQFITEIESEMARTIDRIPYSSKLLAIPGIGPITVAGLIGEVGDFTRFTTQSEITKLAGLDLYEISSGKHKGQRRISKRGRSGLRKILYFAAIQTVRKNGIMHGYYTKLTGRGMKKIMALIAVSRKILRIIYAIIRDNSDYKKDYISLRRKVIKEAA
jgi:transposase